MTSAARIGDLTSHGTPLSPGPGSTSVIIGGRRLWRVGIDFHSCPIVDPHGPHVGGMVLIGKKNVIIEGYQLAGQGDLVVENGSVNGIVSGSPIMV